MGSKFNGLKAKFGVEVRFFLLNLMIPKFELGSGASGVTRGDGNAIDGGTGRSRAEVDGQHFERYIYYF